jgi:hypothetical protein
MPIEISELLVKPTVELDELFKAGTVGPLPDGEAKGTAIISPGTALTKEMSEMVKLFIWQGKTFDAKSGTLRNRILPIGLNAIVAKVYKGTSWFDGKDCIVLDYSETSTVAHWIRDEIRLISPGIYLGLVYWEKDRLIHFALQF